MADATNLQTSFLAGEWSKFAQGRADDPNYKMAMAMCRNAFPVEPGAWVRRGGFLRNFPTLNGGEGRVISLDFKQATPYNMEFTDGFLRFAAGTVLAKTNDPRVVTAISTANPAIVTLDADHGWATDDQVEISNLGLQCPSLQGRQLGITVTDTNKFSLYDTISGAAIDGTSLVFVAPTDGNDVAVARINALVTPYAGDAWKTLRRVQTDNGAVLFHGDVPPNVLTVTAEPDPEAPAFAEFSLAEAEFEDGPYLDPVTNGLQVTPDGLNGTIRLTLSFPQYDATRAYDTGDFVTFHSINYKSLQDANVKNQPDSSPLFWVTVSSNVALGDTDFGPDDVGRHIRLFSEPPNWIEGQGYPNHAKVKYNNQYWISLAVQVAGAPNPGAVLSAWALAPSARVWTWGKITGISNIIDRTLTGSTVGGTFVRNNAAFDGNSNKSIAHCSRAEAPAGLGTRVSSVNAFILRNFSGASDQTIASATVFPPNNQGFGAASVTYQVVDLNNKATAVTGSTGWSLTFQLRASQTNPGLNPAAGTLLGSEVNVRANAPVRILSSDQTTAWKYVWVRAVLTVLNSVAPTPPAGTITQWLSALGVVGISQIQMASGAAVGAGNSIDVKIKGDALLYTQPITTWRLGAFSASSAYPTNGTYHEGRLWLSGFMSNRLDASRAGADNVFNFAPTETDGTVSDSNAISYTLNGPATNPVFWMRPEQQGIVVGTQAGEWLVQATSNNNILTPTSIQAHRVSKHGSEMIEPADTGGPLLFVQRYGRKVLEYFADIFSGKFGGRNLSKMARHLMKAGLAEIMLQQEPMQILWCRMDDGTMIGCSYKREVLSQGQQPEYLGWHKHDIGGDQSIVSIAVGPSADGDLDALSAVILDEASGVYYVCTLTQFFDEDDELVNAQILDGAVIPTSSSLASGVLTLNGLWNRNDETVTVFAGGLDLGDYTVTDGSIAITLASITTTREFTAAYYNAFAGACPIICGTEYVSEGQLLRAVSKEDSGARNGPALGKTQKTTKYAMLLQNAKEMFVGADADTVRPVLFKSPGRAKLSDLEMFSGVHVAELQSDHGYVNMLYWKATGPYPASVIQVQTFNQTSDS